MKIRSIKNLFFLGFVLLGMPNAVFGAAAATDNEIMIQQTGDTLKLYIDQVGYGNKACGTLSGGTCASDWAITGHTLEIDIDQIGNNNKLYGPITLNSSTLDLKWTGDSNSWDWSIGASGNSDDMDMDVEITGDSNTMDLDIGATAAANNLDFDYTVLGDSNVADVDINSATAKWSFNVTGGSNNIKTEQKDSGDHSITAVLVGSDGDWDIVQSSGTCSGIASCQSIIDISVDSEDSVVQITQKDTGD